MPTIYCVDTSAWIDAWNEWYPPTVFPQLWHELENLMQKDLLIAPQDVLIELEKQDDDLYKWAKARKTKFIVELDAPAQTALSEIAKAFKQVEDLLSQKGEYADPIVVALAKSRNATVVSQEKGTGQPNGIKIPDLCKPYGIPCIRIAKVVSDLGLVFKA